MAFVEYYGLAFLSGILLNIMPCVLPVLTMKVFHLMNSHKSHTRSHALAYTAGTVSALLILAAVIILLRASGRSIQWGMHFQNPTFVGILTAVVFTFALNALGVFELHVSSAGGPRTGGLAGAYLSGIFAAVMSTPCTAPLLVTVAGFALALDTPWWHTAGLFASIGLGLAFPFLLISFVTPLARLLPRPGAWMDVFKKVMGFTLLGAAVWLYGVMLHQITAAAATWFLAFLVVIAVSAWGIDHFASPLHSAQRRLFVQFVAFAIIVFAGSTMLDFTQAPRAALSMADADSDHVAVVNNQINWVAFDPERLTREMQRNQPVFVDYTAEWCAACKTNEHVVLETDVVRTAFVRTGVLPMKADMTNEEPVMEKWLAKLGRSGIPAYVIYYPDGTHDLLPVVITTDIVVQRLNEAARRFPERTKRAEYDGSSNYEGAALAHETLIAD